jgi:chemotaxis protein CheY-P-specific phosphatase CheC
MNAPPNIQTVNEAFASGYANSASSFSMFAANKAEYRNLHLSVYKINGNIIDGMKSFGKTVPSPMVTTEVFGELEGKSYLIFSQEEYDWVTRGVKSKPETLAMIKNEFLKELDNIVSAAVITKLSNMLKVKIYGDTPLLEPYDGDLTKLIHKDFAQGRERLYINSCHFTFEANPDIKPLFVWAMDEKIFESAAVVK